MPTDSERRASFWLQKLDWKDASQKPELHFVEEGYQESEKLLLWMEQYGPALGKMVANNGECKFMAEGFRGDGLIITHWSYIPKPEKA